MVRPLSARLAQALRPRRLPQSTPRVRQQQRFASSTPNTEELQKKAQETFASVQKGLGQALEAGKKFLGPVGEKAGNLLGGTLIFPCTFVAASPGAFCTRSIRVVETRLSWTACSLYTVSHSVPGTSAVQLRCLP